MPSNSLHLDSNITSIMKKDKHSSDSPRGLAEKKLEKVDSSNSDVTNRRHSLAATKLDPTCIEAWYLLSQTYDSSAKAIAACLTAIQLGKKEFASEIKGCLTLAKKNNPEEKSWLWGHHEARPFLMAYQKLAELYAIEDNIEISIQTFEEILRLNGTDNQGIRYILLPLYMLHEPAEKIENLLAHFPSDRSAQWLFAKALYTFQKTYALKTADGSWEFNEPEDPNSITGLVLLPQLPSDFSEANDLLKLAMESNGLVPLFLCDIRCSYFSTADSHMIGGADEAFETAQNIGLLWSLDFMSELWLQESCYGPLHRERLVKDLLKHYQHVADLDNMLNQVDIDDIKNPEFARSSKLTAHIRKTLLSSHPPE